MKKLLFIFTMAAICTLATSSFKPAHSANEGPAQSIVIDSNENVNSPEDVKKDDKKQKQAQSGNCCQAKVQKAECPKKQQENCQAAKADCPAAKADCPKKDNCKKK